MKITQRIMTGALALFAGAFSLASCTMDPQAPAASGGISYGALASNNMRDYYYPTKAGYTYVYRHTEKRYDKDGALVSSIAGAYDTLTTLGFKRMSPSGDSLTAFVLKYRLLAQYAGRQVMALPYVLKKANRDDGAWFEGDAIQESQEDEAQFITNPKPKPVGTDTILAGIAGRVKSVADAFASTGARVWQSDTIYFQAERDSVVIWEHDIHTGRLFRGRLLFYKDAKNNSKWQYGLWEGSTYFDVDDVDDVVNVPAGAYRSIDIAVTTPDVYAPIKEHKWFGYTAGLIKQIDTYYLTTTGKLKDKFKAEMIRDLISVTVPGPTN